MINEFEYKWHYWVEVDCYEYHAPLSGVSVYQCDTPEDYYGDETFDFRAHDMETGHEMPQDWLDEHYAAIKAEFLKINED